MTLVEMEPIEIWVTTAGPNPWKVIIILEELSLPYNVKDISLADLKKKPYTDINPNGRAPTIEDPNSGVVLWETAAIIQYLVDVYDTKKTLTYTCSPEKYHVDQWLMFQVSGQGPQCRQAAWFINFHPEQVTSVQEHYVNEVQRIISVLDKALDGKQWLVGNHITYADLAFMTWNAVLPGALGQYYGTIKFQEFPNFMAWNERMMARKSVKKALRLRKQITEAKLTRADLVHK